ncbi:unnamed protein product [Rhodiola kirilowii]
MDFIAGIPSSQGKTVVMVVVDRLTKYAHFRALPKGFTTESVARKSIIEVFRLHGIPSTIVSDRDPLFMTLFWQELFKKHGATLSHSSAYHPQSDGPTEVINHLLKDFLRYYVRERHSDWEELLPWGNFITTRQDTPV